MEREAKRFSDLIHPTPVHLWGTDMRQEFK